MNRYVYFMGIPVLLYYLVFHYATMGGIVVAFQEYKPFKGILGSSWVGFYNFYSFLSSPYAWRVIKNTLIINTYEIIFAFPAPILLALLLNELSEGLYKKVVQTISYMPHFISLVVVCGMIIDFCTVNGLFNNVIAFFGGEPTSLLTRKELFRGIFVSSGIWQNVGWGSIIYLATLSNVDMNLYEAAAIDGAGRFRKVVHITIPALIPTIVTLLIMRLGHVMSLGFEKVVLLYNPLTYETADVVSSFVFRRGLQESNYSLGTAVGLFNSMINIFILYCANTISRKYIKESLW